MTEVLYDIPTAAIALILLAAMIGAIEAGYRVGLRADRAADDAYKSHVNTLENALLGLLALLLGFTFSLALQRYDSRSEAVVNEANAIGTAWLRTQLLPAEERIEAQRLMREYADLRVQASTLTMVAHDERARLVARSNATQTALWNVATRAAAREPNPVTSGLFVQALNDMIDSFGRRDAQLARHVPEIVLLLLLSTFVMAGAIVGYAAGVAAHRPSLVAYALVVLMVVLVFIILDLDRPRRGLIQVSQQSLIDLQVSMRAAQPPAAPR